MKIVLDDVLSDELKDYLLSQKGINYVDFISDGLTTEISIKYDNNITPLIIMKYIDLFQKNEYSTMLEFDKENEDKVKTLKYIIDDMCCEYCYKSLVKDLFENDKIKSVKSSFDFNKPVLNIEFIIEYSDKYSEQELIKYINEKK